MGHLDSRLSELTDRLASVEQQQREGIDEISLQHWMSSAAMIQTMVAGFDRLDRDPPTPMITLFEPRQAFELDETKDEPRPPEPPVVRLEDKQIVGGIEQVLLAPPGLMLEARIDTGAESASVDARDLREFERDGNTWVRFHIMDRETEELFEIERRVVRHVRILQSSTEGYERRPVVEFSLTLGDLSQVAEFTLSDRSHLSLPVLIGRNVIKDVMLVDVGRNHIAPPRRSASDNAGPR